VGGQPSYAFDFDLTAVAKSCGYKETRTASTPEEIAAGTKWLKESAGPVMLEVRTTMGARSDLGRPKSTPQENKVKFIEWIANL